VAKEAQKVADEFDEFDDLTEMESADSILDRQIALVTAKEK
jgi:hypothetical protein